MKKLLAFVTLGAAAFFAYHFPVLDTGEEGLSIHKNYFTGSYTVSLPSEGMEIVFDKRHEDTINALTKVAGLIKDIDKSNTSQKELTDKINDIVSSKMKP